MESLSTCLWFDHQAEAAAQFYVSTFSNSHIDRVVRYGASAAKMSGQTEGKVMCVDFVIDGHRIMGLNGGPHFSQSAAQSFLVSCETAEEVDRLWKSLSQDGEVRMGLEKYPWSDRYGWTADRFGVEWQLMLHTDRPTQKITPSLLFSDKQLGQAEAAAHHYTSLFPKSKIEMMAKDPTGKFVMHSRLTLNGTSQLIVMDNLGPNPFQFSEAFSLMVPCADQSEIDRIWAGFLSAGGSPSECGWLKDRFGISWQVHPVLIRQWHSDPNKSEALMKAMIGMKKLDFDILKRATENA